jgi:hypothetical protein
MPRCAARRTPDRRTPSVAEIVDMSSMTDRYPIPRDRQSKLHEVFQDFLELRTDERYVVRRHT